MLREILSHHSPDRLSRRQLIKLAGATALLPLTYSESAGAQESPAVPESLVNILSLSPDYLNNNPQVIKSMAFTRGNYATVMAAFELLGDNSILKTTFDRTNGVYLPPETKTALPLDEALNLIAMPSSKLRAGQETIIAGGYNLQSQSPPIPGLAVSKDGGDTYRKIITQEGEITPGVVVRMKHIPQTNKLLLHLYDFVNAGFNYGIYDVGSDKFNTVTPPDGDYYGAADISDIAISPDRKTALGSGIYYGSGYNTAGQQTPIPLALNEFAIDLDTNQMTKYEFHNIRNVPVNKAGAVTDFVVTDLTAARDTNGESKMEYQIRTQFDRDGYLVERRIFYVDMENPGKKTTYHDIGTFLDLSIKEETGAPGLGIPTRIMKTENGMWIFGQDGRSTGPFAAYVSDENTLIYPHDKAEIYTFNGIKNSYISKEPQRAKYFNKSSLDTIGGLDPEEVGGTHIIDVILEGAGKAGIETTGRGDPHPGKQVYYSVQPPTGPQS